MSDWRSNAKPPHPPVDVEAMTTPPDTATSQDAMDRCTAEFPGSTDQCTREAGHEGDHDTEPAGKLFGASLGSPPKDVQSRAERDHWAEEYECAMMVLDDFGVPRKDVEGSAYSLVGRIARARDKRAQEEYQRGLRDGMRSGDPD